MRVQFFSPHPDDIEVFCGGTFLRHVADGDEVTALMMTRGGAGAMFKRWRGEPLEARRTAEAIKRYAEVPDVQVIWLDFRDGAVKADAAAMKYVEGMIESSRPQMIYLPESSRSRSYYWHPDHINTGRIVEAAASRIPGVTRRYYHSRRVNCIIDIDPYFERSQSALRFYATQYAATAYPPFLLHVVERLRRLTTKSRGRRAGCRYAEGFREVQPEVES
jgi:LmbE family N-acetylglucosaminyl deacetylase